MNAFKTQPVREKYNTPWQSEYIIGMVQNLGNMSTTRVLDMCESQSIMSRATAHKYLMLSVDLKLLQQNRGSVDKRETKLDLTAKGEKFLEELKHAHR
jgi:hypothetical protein